MDPEIHGKKGRIANIYRVKDGKIRMVDVKTSNSTTFRRPVSRLIVLDVKK